MSNVQSSDSLRELNTKFAEIVGENAEIPKLRKKVAEDEVERMKRTSGHLHKKGRK